jgi:hypothetical protein
MILGLERRTNMPYAKNVRITLVADLMGLKIC